MSCGFDPVSLQQSDLINDPMRIYHSISRFFFKLCSMLVCHSSPLLIFLSSRAFSNLLLEKLASYPESFHVHRLIEGEGSMK